MAINNLNNLLNTSAKVGSKPAQVSSADVSASSAKSAQEASTNATKSAVPQDAVVLTDQAQLLAKLQQKYDAAVKHHNFLLSQKDKAFADHLSRVEHNYRSSWKWKKR